MTLNKKQFGIGENGKEYPQAWLDLVDLANMPSYPESHKDFDPSTASNDERMGFFKAGQEYQTNTIKPMATRVFESMNRDGIPHHPKIKAQYDRGLISANEYAAELLNILGHS